MARIYVSSTYLDLKEHRDRVCEVIKRAEHEDIAMEYYVAEDKRPVDRCLQDVSECDLYIGIFAWRYGWVPRCKNRKRLSITEMEYRRALSVGKDCLIFLLDERALWRTDWVDEDRSNIRRLRNELAEQHGGDIFKSVDELGQHVTEALHRWAKPKECLGSFTSTKGRLPIGHRQFLDEACEGAEFESSAVAGFRTLLRDGGDVGPTLASQNFLERNGLISRGWLTRTGVLLFQSKPDSQNELSSAYVKCSLYEPGRKPKVKDIRGTAYAQITAAVSFVRQNTPKSLPHYESGLARRIDLDPYPMFCLREVLANAVCHRDYSDSNRTIHLRILPNEIKILSPGTWMGDRPIHGQSELDVVRSESKTRNTTLAKLLSWINYVEREGCGIDKAVRDCRANDASLPMIEERDGFVIVTIYPSQKFSRASRGELGKVRVSTNEIAEKLEQEQLAHINSLDSNDEKMRAVNAYGEKDFRSALQLLRKVKDIPAKETLLVLQRTTGWDGDDLAAYTSNWLYQGEPAAEIVQGLLELGKSQRSPRTIAYVYYSLLRNKMSIGKNEFFSACWRPIRDDLTVNTIEIPAQRFLMGSSDPAGPDDEHPQHEVELASYRIGRSPVTCKEYAFFIGENSCSSLPIAGLTWWEAWIFCEWMGGSLPSEAQWECACRAGTTTKWWTGDDEQELLAAAWIDEGADGDPHPVGEKAENPWELVDVHGNVSEWCLDRYGLYLPNKQVNPLGRGPTSDRVLRGGNSAAAAHRSRSACRDHTNPGDESILNGCRIAFGERLDLC